VQGSVDRGELALGLAQTRSYLTLEQRRAVRLFAVAGGDLVLARARRAPCSSFMASTVALTAGRTGGSSSAAKRQAWQRRDARWPRLVVQQSLARPSHAFASFSKRTITRTASHSRLLSLGSCTGAAVTVLSTRITRPRSSFVARAPVSSARLICSQVVARIALIVWCSTDFWRAPRLRQPGECPERR
jgi:hypothetical protein